MFFSAEGNYNNITAGKWKWDTYTVDHVASPRIKHGIILIIKGKIIFKTEKEIKVATAGDVIFVPKGSCYYALMQNTENYLVNFENDSLEGSEPVKLFCNADRRYYEYFDEAIDMQIKSESELFLKSRFYRFIDLINKEHEGRRSENSIVKKAKKLLDNDPDLSITDIAKECAVSESGLRNKFKEAFGFSPMEYKMKVKINKAKFLLESTSLNTAEISEELGFYDAAYFSKIFKKYTGVSPTDYLKKRTL